MSLCVEAITSIQIFAKSFCRMCRWTSSAEGRFPHKLLLFLFVAFVCVFVYLLHLFVCLFVRAKRCSCAGGSVNPPAAERLAAGRLPPSSQTIVVFVWLFICCICLFDCLSELKGAGGSVNPPAGERLAGRAASSFLTNRPQSTSAPIAVRCFSAFSFSIRHLEFRSRWFQNLNFPSNLPKLKMGQHLISSLPHIWRWPIVF